MISGILFPIGIALLLLSCSLFALMINEGKQRERRRREEFHQVHQLPPGELVYENISGAGEEIYSDHFPLIATPTYVVRIPTGDYIPIEVQPEEIHAMKPLNHHMLQVVADSLILEDYADTPPAYGILRYPDREFIIDYTASRRRKAIRHLEEMNLCDEEHQPALQKQRASKCHVCLFQTLCPIGQEHLQKNQT